MNFRRTFQCIISAILLCIASKVSGQTYYFTHYDKSSGLCYQNIQCALQDKYGFMWFGTRSGLSRFDGHTFKNYWYDNEDPSSLQDGTINAMVEARDGSIWLSNTFGLIIYSPENETFSTFSCPEFEIKESVRLSLDNQGNLIAYNSKGIYFIGLDEGYNKFFPSSEYPTARDLIVSQSGRIWYLGANGLLHLFDVKRGIINSYPILTDKDLENRIGLGRLVEDSGGNLVITTTTGGARYFSVKTNSVTTLFDTDMQGGKITIHTVMRNDDEFWFGTENGVYIYKIGTGFIENLTKSIGNPYSLSDNSIHTLYKDKEGGIWLGSYFRGLDYLSNDNTLFKKYYPKDQTGAIKANVIREICNDYQGNLWIGTEDGGLCHFNTKTEEFISVDGLVWNGVPITKNIQSLIFKDQSHLWIGTYNEGIYVLDILSGRIIRRFSRTSPDDSGLPTGICCIRQIASGQILVGTRNGLFIYLEEDDRFEYIAGATHMIRGIYEDSQGTVWLGTIDSGIYSVKADSLKPGATLSHMPFVTERITTFYETPQKKLWIGTEGLGILQYDPNYNTYSSILSKDDFPGLIVYQILEDALGSLWLSTSEGLIQYIPHEGMSHQYTTANGLPTNQFDYNSSFQDNSGTIFLGTVNGMIAFSPERMITDQKSPEVYFTDFRLSNQKTDAMTKDSPLDKSILFTKKIVLKNDQNTFNISYASPVFSISRNIWYRYKMEGVDSDWHITPKPDVLSYTKLSPGKYTLMIQASNNKEIWTGNPSTLTFVIKHQLLLNPWAYCLYILLFLIVFYYYVKLHNANIRKDEELTIERLKSEKEKEAFNTMVNFFTNITHEIRTPLTLITGSINNIRRTNAEMTENKNFCMMEKNTRRLLDLVNQLLDFRKIESSAFQMNFKKLNISTLTKEIINQFFPAAQAKHVTIESNLIDNCFVIADKEAITKILSNLFSNALKYCSRVVIVTLDTYMTNDKSDVRITVKNDGEKLPESDIAEIFKPFIQYKSETGQNFSTGTGLGLPLASSLASLQNGTLGYDKNEHTLNSFVFTLPLVVEQEDEPLEEKSESSPSPSDNTISFENKNKHSILVVDDETDMREYYYQELSDCYNVYLAENGEIALDILEEHSIAVIISDIMMPILDGISLCNKIKEDPKFCHIPFIVVTAKVSPQDHIDAMNSKADAFIEKPFSSELLMAQISNLISNRELIHSTFINSPYAHMSTIASNSLDQKFLEKMNNYIMNNLSNPNLSVESMAEYMNMSISSLFRKVKSTTSLPPRDFIRLCRLKKAAELLSQREKNISEISDYVGFSSPSYFTTCFMKQFGMTPKEFTKKDHRG